VLIRCAPRQVLLVKPQTFMNCSGESVVPLLKFYKVPPSRLLVLYDDLDIDVRRAAHERAPPAARAALTPAGRRWRRFGYAARAGTAGTTACAASSRA
jgi:hypothetical protein